MIDSKFEGLCFELSIGVLLSAQAKPNWLPEPPYLSMRSRQLLLLASVAAAREWDTFPDILFYLQ
jgi:hypothetical protein